MKNSKYLFIVLVFGLLLQSCKSYTSNIIFKAEPTDMNWKSAYEKAVVENPIKVGDKIQYSIYTNHVLLETSFMNKPVFFNQLLFEVKTAGYMPVLAHPERYIYLQDDYEEAERILDIGVKFQINLMSLASYYSPMAKKFSQWLIKNGHYHFLGTDAHSINHLKVVKEVLGSKLFSQIDFNKVENAR